MGVLYCGPYADLLGGAHEGYAARVLPDGSLTATWTAATAEFRGFVAACDCGWTGTERYPATEEGEDQALAQWRAEHLRVLLAQVAERGWPRWAARVAGLAGRVADAVAAGRVSEAAAVAEELAEETHRWALRAGELAQTQDHPHADPDAQQPDDVERRAGGGLR